MNDNHPFDKVSMLTEGQRKSALRNAREEIAGDKPVLESVEGSGGQYPFEVKVIVGILMALAFLGAAYPSLVRLFNAGRDAFFTTIPDQTQADIAGVATFLMATFLIILSTVSARVFFNGTLERIAFIIPIGVGLAVEAVGNFIMVRPDLAARSKQTAFMWLSATDHAQVAFAWLETLAPPIVVLFIALVAERLILDSVHATHQRKTQYDADLKAWQGRCVDAHLSVEWPKVRANKLREMLRDANKRSPAVLRSLTDFDWRMLVMRELDADAWYERAQVHPQTQHDERNDDPAPMPEPIRIDRATGALPQRTQRRRTQQPSGRGAGKYTGELDDSVTQNANGTFTAACPKCESKFEGPTSFSAKMSLVGHMKKHQTTQTEVNANGHV